MLYLAAIWIKWDTEADLDPEEFARYEEFQQAAQAAGVLRGGDALHPVSAATTVRVRDAETLLTDGPFAETKEQLSGYFLFECADLDEAIGWAARIPGARHGAIEVRPVFH